MLIIVNPYATTVSDRLKNLVVYALQGRYQVEAAMTEAQSHATEICREAAQGGYDLVVAFGGDGTLNEVANGLLGSDVPVSVLPGGATNVVCRTLGIPADVVDATEHLLGLADDLTPRRIDLGRVNGRHFVFSCGVGLDASVVRQVDARPKLKATAGPFYFTWAAIENFYLRYLGRAVRMAVETEAGATEGITAVVQNSDPFTYFGDRPVRVCEDVSFDSGTLSVAVLKRAAQRDVPFIMGRVLMEGFKASEHRHIDHFAGLQGARVESISKDGSGEQRPFPLQVDGDFIGEYTSATYGITPKALAVVA
jgi:diacylglycerol kinase family enzyme